MNTPFPPLQVTPEELVMLPASWIVSAFVQLNIALPASTIGESNTVKSICEVSARQVPGASVVSVNENDVFVK